MSVSWPGSMRGPRLRIPRLLLLLLLLLSTLTTRVLCQDEDSAVEAEEENPAVEPDTEPETETEPEPADPEPDPGADEYSDAGPVGDDVTETSEPPAADPEAADPDAGPAEETTDNGGSGNDEGNSDPIADPTPVSPSTSLPGDGEDEGLSPIIILIPVVLVVLIIAMIVCGIFINRRWNQKARDQDLRKEDPYLDGTSTEKVPMPMFEEDVPSVLELEMEELDQWMKKDGETAEDSKLP